MLSSSASGSPGLTKVTSVNCATVGMTFASIVGEDGSLARQEVPDMLGP